MTSSKNLDDLRHAVMCGLADRAQSLLGQSPGFDVRVEAALLALLQFQLPDIPDLNSDLVDAATQCRFLMLQGIVLNRKRDPLGALAKFQEALQSAGSDRFLQIDVFLETAKAYAWLGNSSTAIDFLLQALSLSTQKSSQFLVFSSLADLYAELERWQMAQHYAALSQASSHGLEDSIYYTQLLECEARIELALGKEGSSPLAALQNREPKLPAYLQFRLAVLLLEKVLVAQDRAASAGALAKLQHLSLCAVPESFEFTVTQVLSARLDLLQENPKPAISKLIQARDWYADEDLAVRFVDALILLTKAYAQNGQKNEAAIELNIARTYCQARGLGLQLERVESAFADYDLVLYPITESKRSSSSGSWKNRQAYVILEKLGEGGQGAVFRAFDNARNKTVAFKKLKIKGAAALEALAREVRSANWAAVPNVARVLACGTEDDGSLYMVQELINGQSLRAMLVKGEKPPILIAHLQTVAKTLKALHAKGIVHGDVKPENILIDADGATILVDFGLARITGRDPVEKVGATARYAPPALAAQLRAAQWRDTYALGVMLCECLGPEETPEAHAARKLAAKLTRSFNWPFAASDYEADWNKLLR